ncbi:MAG: hypothetical protein WBM13_10710 [Bacteroidia bacterium]
METFIEKSFKTNRIGNFKSGALLILLTVFSFVQCMAESETFTKTKEQAEHETTMSYIYMIVGFVAIIAIAWFSVKKSSSTQQTHHHPPASHHHHHHSIHDKRYGTNHAR